MRPIRWVADSRPPTAMSASGSMTTTPATMTTPCITSVQTTA